MFRMHNRDNTKTNAKFVQCRYTRTLYKLLEICRFEKIVFSNFFIIYTKFSDYFSEYNRFGLRASVVDIVKTIQSPMRSRAVLMKTWWPGV